LPIASPASPGGQRAATEARHLPPPIFHHALDDRLHSPGQRHRGPDPVTIIDGIAGEITCMECSGSGWWDYAEPLAPVNLDWPSRLTFIGHARRCDRRHRHCCRPAEG
jgi:hypothetical protein